MTFAQHLAGAWPPAIRLVPIRTSRLILRPPVPSDRDRLADAYARSAAHFDPWFPRRPAGETWPQTAERQIARAHDGLHSGSACRLIAVTGTGEPVGSFNLNNLVRGAFQNADFGWSLFEGHTGRGLATEALRAMLNLAFAPRPEPDLPADGIRTGLGLHRVQANIMPRNGPSLRLAERLGFRREGVALRMLEIAGTWEDHILHALTAEEWSLS